MNGEAKPRLGKETERGGSKGTHVLLTNDILLAEP